MQRLSERASALVLALVPFLSLPCAAQPLGSDPSAERGPPDGASRPERAPSFELIWSAPADCPTRDEVIAGVDELLGRPVASALGNDVHVRAELSRVAGQWQLELRWATPTAASRVLVADTCADLGRIAALAVALAIDPEVVAFGSPRDTPPASPAPVALGDPWHPQVLREPIRAV